MHLNVVLAESLAYRGDVGQAGEVLANVRSMVGRSPIGTQAAMGLRIA